MKKKLKRILNTLVFFITVIIAAAVPAFTQIIEINFNFRSGTNGWTADFADYSPNTGTDYELLSAVRFMPRKVTRVPVSGIYIQGHNRSDDLFMFLKRRLTAADGIAANRNYRIEYVITFASNAASGCFGIGGSPGESVYLKAGASQIEPLAVLQTDGFLRMNVDKGNQSTGGLAASVTGNIANGIPCDDASPYFPFVLIERAHVHPTNVRASASGELWLFMGTDSGFEGLTRLYFQKIRVRLIPV